MDISLVVKIKKIILPFKQNFSIYCFSTNSLKQLVKRLSYQGFYSTLVELRNYSTVRNSQLIVPCMMGSDVVATLDDDEIVNDKDYLSKAAEFIGEKKITHLLQGLVDSISIKIVVIAYHSA